MDDDPAILEILHAYLSGEGYEVWQASDGHHARELMSRADLAILDWMLP
ncbi:response regulator, partial [Deinococcus aerolatus]